MFVLVGKGNKGTGQYQIHVFSGKAHETLDDARAAASELVQSGQKDEVFVAQIVGKVHRSTPPVVWSGTV